MKERWVTVALTNDALVAELLVRLKQSSSSDLSHTPPARTSITAGATTSSLVPPVGWGHRKSRSKPSTATATATINASSSGFRKEQQHQRGSPTTPLSWSGGGGASTSDGYDESSRPSDLSSGGRSSKSTDGATTSSYNKSKKRKSFAELKEEEGYLLKERVLLNRELASMRVTLNQQMATSKDLKRIKTDMHQSPVKEEMERRVEHEPKNQSTINQCVQISCKVEAEMETMDRGFILPDLNMTPCEEELAILS